MIPAMLVIRVIGFLRKVLVLACEHAAPLPEDSLESLVQLCRSLWDAKDVKMFVAGKRFGTL